MSKAGHFYRGTETYATQPESRVIDVAKMEEVLSRIPPDPLAAWMRQQGFDPAKGAILVLPEDMASELGAFPPNYVRPNPLVEVPVILYPPRPETAPAYTVEQP